VSIILDLVLTGPEIVGRAKSLIRAEGKDKDPGEIRPPGASWEAGKVKKGGDLAV
jgi:hypothetical protein